MKKSRKIAGVIAAAGLGLAVVSAYADPHGGSTGTGNGPHTQGGMQHGMKDSVGSDAMSHGPDGHGAEHAGLTPEERTAFQEKMLNAKTADERQKIAAAMHTQMQKQAEDTTHAEHRGPGASREHSRGNAKGSHPH